MPVAFASASGVEPAKEPDLVMVDEAGLPARITDAHERRLVYRPRGDLIRYLDDGIGTDSKMPQLLRVNETNANERSEEAMRVCAAYRMTNKVNDPQNRLRHLIDKIF